MRTEKYNNINIDRLLELNEKFRHKNASQEDKDELMRILYLNNSINRKLYVDYARGFNSDFLVTGGLLIARMILIGYIFKKSKISIS